MGKCLFMRKGEVHTAPISGILASDLAVGSTVKLMENGVAAEYLVVNQGIPSNSTLYDASCNGTWLLRKDIKEKRQWHSSNSNSYKASTIHSYLNSTFLGLLDSDIQSVIKQVKIPYVNGTANAAVASGASGLSTKVFLLGGYEVGFTTSINQYFPIDGARLSYFQDGSGAAALGLRNAYLNGSAADWWLRSPRTLNATYAWGVYTDGNNGTFGCTASCGVRPALILPSNALFDAETLILKGVA